MAQGSADPEDQTVADVPCLACGCLCDDIAVTVRERRIVSAERACSRGASWFLQEREPADWPDATVEGTAATKEAGLDRAAGILRASRSPVVIGLSNSSSEAQGAAVALADRIGAVVALAHEDRSLARLSAFQRVGRVSASLGEVKARADVIVYWGVDPSVTHPRHFERYSVDSSGRFAPARRLLLVADDRETETMKRADMTLILNRAERLRAIQTLRAMTRGLVADESLRRWHEALRSARYGAWFFGSTFGEDLLTTAEQTELMKLVRELNEDARFVALPMGEAGNATGAENVLAWQTGYPTALSLARGYPSFEPEWGALRDRLSSGEFDAALIVGAVAPIAGLPPIPTIAIGPNATRPGGSWSVGMAASTPGIGGGGTVMRCDGVMLPLRPALPSRWPDETQWLAGLEEALR